MVVSYGEHGDSCHADVPRQWSEVRIPFLYIRGFDLHPDGQRFAVLHEVTGLDQSRRDQVVLFLNFFDELRRLAPAK